MEELRGEVSKRLSPHLIREPGHEDLRKEAQKRIADSKKVKDKISELYSNLPKRVAKNMAIVITGGVGRNEFCLGGNHDIDLMIYLNKKHVNKEFIGINQHLIKKLKKHFNVNVESQLITNSPEEDDEDNSSLLHLFQCENAQVTSFLPHKIISENKELKKQFDEQKKLGQELILSNLFFLNQDMDFEELLKRFDEYIPELTRRKHASFGNYAEERIRTFLDNINEKQKIKKQVYDYHLKKEMKNVLRRLKKEGKLKERNGKYAPGPNLVKNTWQIRQIFSAEFGGF